MEASTTAEGSTDTNCLGMPMLFSTANMTCCHYAIAACKAHWVKRNLAFIQNCGHMHAVNLLECDGWLVSRTEHRHTNLLTGKFCSLGSLQQCQAG